MYVKEGKILNLKANSCLGEGYRILFYFYTIKTIGRKKFQKTVKNIDYII